MSYFAILSGSIASIFVTNINWIIFFIVYSTLAILLITVGVDSSPKFVFKGSDICVVILTFSIRLLDGFLIPILFKEVGNKHPHNNEAVTRWIAAMTKIFMLLLTWCSYGFVESGVIS